MKLDLKLRKGLIFKSIAKELFRINNEKDEIYFIGLHLFFCRKKIWLLCAIRFLYFFFNLAETGYVVDIFLDNFINERDTRYSATNINLLYHTTTFCSVEPICLEFEWSSLLYLCRCPELLNEYNLVKPFHEF